MKQYIIFYDNITIIKLFVLLLIIKIILVENIEFEYIIV